MRPVRWVLTAGLIYGVYRETGIFTALFALLVGVTLELLPVVVERDIYRSLIDLLETAKDKAK